MYLHCHPQLYIYIFSHSYIFVDPARTLLLHHFKLPPPSYFCRITSYSMTYTRMLNFPPITFSQSLIVTHVHAFDLHLLCPLFTPTIFIKSCTLAAFVFFCAVSARCTYAWTAKTPSLQFILSPLGDPLSDKLHL
jgi:hypothetical protein